MEHSESESEKRDLISLDFTDMRSMNEQSSVLKDSIINCLLVICWTCLSTRIFRLSTSTYQFYTEACLSNNLRVDFKTSTNDSLRWSYLFVHAVAAMSTTTGYCYQEEDPSHPAGPFLSK